MGSSLENLAIALRNQDQLVAHSGSRGIRDRAIQHPTGAIDLMVAADDLDEA